MSRRANRAKCPTAMFLRHLRPVESPGCWEWAGSTYPNGYGRVCIALPAGQIQILAHRYSYEFFVGPIPDGLHIDHLCRNRRCVNPAHLEPVTPRENVCRGRSSFNEKRLQTHCKRGHEFTPENTYVPPYRRDAVESGASARFCRACMAAREAIRPRRKKIGGSGHVRLNPPAEEVPNDK